jgi:hypothetical protein
MNGVQGVIVFVIAHNITLFLWEYANSIANGAYLTTTLLLEELANHLQSNQVKQIKPAVKIPRKKAPKHQTPSQCAQELKIFTSPQRRNKTPAKLLSSPQSKKICAEQQEGEEEEVERVSVVAASDPAPLYVRNPDQYMP